MISLSSNDLFFLYMMQCSEGQGGFLINMGSYAETYETARLKRNIPVYKVLVSH